MISFISGKMKSTTLFLLICLSLLNTTAADIDGCILANKKLSCEDYQASVFPYDADYKTVAEITIKGTFSEMNISFEYKRIRKITLRSDNLKEFNFKSYIAFLKLRAVDVRDNNIERVDFTGVHNLTSITQILLSSNKIKTLDGCEDLKQASSLSAISFQDNELEQIDLNCFPKNLAKLHLHYNNIKSLSECQPLKDLTSLTILSVAFNNLQVFDFDCIPLSMTNLMLYRNNISQVQNCQSLKNLPNLGRLALSGNNLESFDFSCLPTTVHEVLLFDNKISRVESCSSLQALTMLSGLFLNNNQLDSFDLSCLPKDIVSLSLANNSISDISSCETLRNLSRLKNLYLNGNDFSSFNFSCLPDSLTDLDLENNTISQIFSFNSLSRLPDLTRLSLAQNAIDSVDFRHLPQSVKYMYLHDNLLSNIDLGLLSRFAWVYISVYDNPITCSCMLLVQYVKLVQSPNVQFQCSNESGCVTCIDFLQSYPWTEDIDALRRYDDGSMGCFTSYLKEASLSRSNVTKGCILKKVHDLLPRIVCHEYGQNNFSFREDFKDAESLSVRGDFSSFVAIDSRYTQLRHIKLGSYALTEIDMSIFNGFSMLKIIDFSRSGIKNITISSSANLTSLDEINLDRNNLSTTSFIGNQSFNIFPNVKRLYLRNNRLEALEIKHLPRRLTELDVGSNLISDIIFDGIEMMIGLKFFDLSYNELASTFPLNRIPGSIEKLRLRGNKISNINMNSCVEFQTVKLDVRENPLNCSCDLVRGLDACSSNIELECNTNSTMTCFTCRWKGLEETSFQTTQQLKDDKKMIKCDQAGGSSSNAVRITAMTSNLVFIVGVLSSLVFNL